MRLNPSNILFPVYTLSLLHLGLGVPVSEGTPSHDVQPSFSKPLQNLQKRASFFKGAKNFTVKTDDPERLAEEARDPNNPFFNGARNFNIVRSSSGAGAPGGSASVGRGGRAPGGRALSGGAPSGRASSGRAPSGRAPSGRAPSGRAPSGIAPSGRAPSGIAPGGRARGGGRQQGQGSVGGQNDRNNFNGASGFTINGGSFHPHSHTETENIFRGGNLLYTSTRHITPNQGLPNVPNHHNFNGASGFTINGGDFSTVGGHSSKTVNHYLDNEASSSPEGSDHETHTTS